MSRTIVLAAADEQTSPSRWARILLIIGRLALALIFLIAGYSKIKPLPGWPWSPGSLALSLLNFAREVDAYQMLPPQAVLFVSHILPFFELFLGLWVLSGIALRLSSVISMFAFSAFMVAIAWAYHRNLVIPCGCGIGPDEQVGPKALVRDGLGFLLVLAVTVVAFRMRRRQVPAGI